MIVAIILAAILLFLSMLHVYWALGGRWGSAAVIPTVAAQTAHSVQTTGDIQTTGDTQTGKNEETPLFVPPTFATLAVASALLVAVILVLWRASLLILPLPNWMLQASMWGIAVVFALRAVGEFRYMGFFKRVRHTQFAQMDTILYSPLCLLIALLALWLQI